MKIMVVGTFDVDNYGDCLFPDVLKNELQCRMENVETVLFSPTPRVSKLGNYDKVEQLPGTLKECENIKYNSYDVIILAGGEVLQNGHAPNGLYCMIPPNSMSAGMRLWMTPAILKAKREVHYIVNAVGVGGIDNNVKEGLSAALQLSDYKSVREEYSAAFLKKIGCETQVGIDSAFALPRLFEKQKWETIAERVLPSGLELGSYLVVHASIQYIAKKFADWCKAIKNVATLANLPVLLLPICYHHSDRVTLYKASRVLKGLGVNVKLITKYLKTTETAAIIACSSGFCGTSLHGAISSVAFEKPTAVFVKRIPGKHDGVLKNLGMSANVTTNLEDLSHVFKNSLKSDRHMFAQKGMEGAMQGFDVIMETIKKPASNNIVDKDQWEDMVHAIEIDSLYHMGLKSTLTRPFYKIIRSNPYLNELYDAFSGLIKGRFN